MRGVLDVTCVSGRRARKTRRSLKGEGSILGRQTRRFRVHMSAHEQHRYASCDEHAREGPTRRQGSARGMGRNLMSRKLLPVVYFRNWFKPFLHTLDLLFLPLRKFLLVVLPILYALQQPQRRDLLLDRPGANHTKERGGNSRAIAMKEVRREKKSKETYKLQAVFTLHSPRRSTYDRNHNPKEQANRPHPRQSPHLCTGLFGFVRWWRRSRYSCCACMMRG